MDKIRSTTLDKFWTINPNLVQKSSGGIDIQLNLNLSWFAQSLIFAR